MYIVVALAQDDLDAEVVPTPSDFDWRAEMAKVAADIKRLKPIFGRNKHNMKSSTFFSIVAHKITEPMLELYEKIENSGGIVLSGIFFDALVQVMIKTVRNKRTANLKVLPYHEVNSALRALSKFEKMLEFIIGSA